MQQPATVDPEKIARLIRHSLDLAYAEACALRGMFANLPDSETTNEMKFHLERLAAQLVEISDLTSAFQAPVRAELLRTIREARSQFFAAVLQVPPERLVIPIAGSWSVKDIVGHVTFWEQIVAERLELIAEGRAAEIRWFSDEETHEENARAIEVRRARTWEEIAVEADETGDRLLGALAALDEEQITGGSPSVLQWLPNSTTRHYAEHLPEVQRALIDGDAAPSRPRPGGVSPTSAE